MHVFQPFVPRTAKPAATRHGVCPPPPYVAGATAPPRRGTLRARAWRVHKLIFLSSPASGRATIPVAWCVRVSEVRCGGTLAAARPPAQGRCAHAGEPLGAIHSVGRGGLRASNADRKSATGTSCATRATPLSVEAARCAFHQNGETAQRIGDASPNLWPRQRLEPLAAPQRRARCSSPVRPARGNHS